MVVIVYDISTRDQAGKRRLRKISRKCAAHGIAVQNSVYECLLNADQFRALRSALEALILPEQDSIRFYLLGNHYQSRIDRLGKAPAAEDYAGFVI